MEDRDYQDIILPTRAEVGTPVPCLNAEKGRYQSKLILLCRDHKGKNAPSGIKEFEDGQLCYATCFKEGKFIPQVYLDTSKIKDCPYVI
jgi:hypothetical protein